MSTPTRCVIPYDWDGWLEVALMAARRVHEARFGTDTKYPTHLRSLGAFLKWQQRSTTSRPA
jgi:hypothetical protein